MIKIVPDLDVKVYLHKLRILSIEGDEIHQMWHKETRSLEHEDAQSIRSRVDWISIRIRNQKDPEHDDLDLT
uniref:Uncharacterized protein n=1 Tax=Lepeophtheirus salmonis TaxID=72036 RepID=A0A0K2V064_LEPSM